jgi:hypothetical protein
MNPPATIQTNAMPMRDWLAGQALAGILASLPPPLAGHYASQDTIDKDIEIRAKKAYQYADAMMQARGVPGGSA